jgi:tRNA threonylcarbamoyladenosine biosynthesis protein TsaB
MSLLLALDTATDLATLAVGDERRVLERLIRERRDLSARIEVVAAELLREAAVAPRDLAGVVVADGPGGFTGLRIGVAFAKGLVSALGVPLHSVPSMLGAAWAVARGAGEVEVRYDALRGEVYRARYHLGPDTARVLVPPDLAPGVEPAEPGVRAASERDASAAALLAVARLMVPAPIADVGAWEPAYGRPAEAEARRLASSGDGR